MKVCMIETGWQRRFVIPIELAGFLPQMFLVDVEGYGSEAKLIRSTESGLITFVDAESILPERPAVAPAPLVLTPQSATQSVIDDDTPF